MKFEQIETLNSYLKENNYNWKAEQHIVVKPEKTFMSYLIKYDDETQNMYPTVYHDERIEKMSIPEFADYIEHIILASPKHINIEKLLTKDMIAENVLPRFVNSSHVENLEKNGTFYNVWCDLLIIYYVEVIENATVTITKSLIDHMNMEDFDFHTQAIKNLEDKTTIQNMEKVLMEMTGKIEDMPEDLMENVTFPPMYVATNTNKLYGAPVVLTKKFAATVKELIGEKAFILPSSIHEVIVIPADEERLDEATEMIREVNRTNLLPEEILSDHPYIFNRGLISMP